MTMSDEQQPELRWAPIPPKPSRAKRVWLVAGIVLAALIIAIIVFIALLPHREEPDADGTASPSPSATASPSSAPTASPTPTDEPTAPVISEPPVADPDLGAFRNQVSVWLESAPTGLDIVSRSSGQDALQVIDTLQEDAQRLSDAQPPSSILEQWHSGVGAYADSLSALRTAVSSGSGLQDALDEARTDVQNLNTIVGL
jgi:hypothetical protein